MKTYEIKINDNTYRVGIASVSDGKAEVVVNGEQLEVDIKSVPEASIPSRKAIRTPENKDTVFAARAASSTAPKSITSPLPGTIIRLEVHEGESIRRGQRIAIIEAMKMENDILSPRDGVVSALYIREGDSVLEGADIASIV